MTLSRRGVLGLGAVALGAVLTACGRQRPPAPAPVPDLSSQPVPSSSTPVAATTSPTRVPTPTSSRPAGPAVELSHGSRTRPQVALTFHGAGDDSIARDLLALFAQHQVKVTVFAVGTWLAQSPSVAKEVHAAGHELGNHTYSHLDIDSLAADQATSEIVRCRDLLRSLTGSPGVHFRPSQAQHATPEVLQLAGRAGYRTCVSYDIDSLDYTDPGPTAIRQNVAAAQPGSIISLHFGHSGTVSAMPGILADLSDRGLTPVTTSMLLST